MQEPATTYTSDLTGALAALDGHIRGEPIGLILGSGLGPVVDICEESFSVPYSAIEGAPDCRVEGHEGRLIVGSIEDRPVVAFSGRVHLYEGWGLEQITYQVRLLKALGARAVVLTSSVGGVNPEYAPGAFMMVKDHINLTGTDPVSFVPPADRVPAFPSMARCYHPVLLERLTELAFSAGVPYHRGVLAAVRGPCYETPAEVKALRALGADAVCMSTVLEAAFAHYLGLRVLAICLVSNRAGDEAGSSHGEVLKTVTEALPRAREFLSVAFSEMTW